MMGPYGYGGGWGWMAAGWITMLMFWVLVIVGVVAVVRWANVAGIAGSRSETPVEILRRRYAAGELTKEQFESMKRDVA
jgi:putative membrane protein